MSKAVKITMIFFGLFALTSGGIGLPLSTRKLQGRIVAYRTVEHAFQDVSFSENVESFLFSVSSSKTASRSEVIKLVYEHLGYSQIKDDAYVASSILTLHVQRDKSCDETFESFLSNAPVLRQEDAPDVLSGGVKFLGSFQKSSLAPGEVVACHRLSNSGLPPVKP